MNIGVICLDAGKAATVTDHINAITKGSRHNSVVLPVWPDNILLHIDLSVFDVLVIHYTIVAKDHTFLVREVRERIASFTGLKVAFIQDEYRFINATIDALSELGIGLLFTCVPEPEIEKVYSPGKLPGMRALNVLTGYVQEDLLRTEVPPYENRPIDVGYRSRKVPMWLGELGWEKYFVSQAFPEAAARYRLRLDISCREEDRIYGEDWIRFTYNCKAFLGVESGASVFDFTGEIQRQVETHEARDPDVSFEELQRLYFAEHEGKIRLNQISPRCFEAAALRTLLVLYEGDYSDILIPWRHFVPLKKDYSNMNEVVEVILDRKRATDITDAAYTEVACNPEYSFAAFGEYFDREIEATILPTQLRRSSEGRIRQEIDAAMEQLAREKPIIAARSKESFRPNTIVQVVNRGFSGLKKIVRVVSRGLSHPNTIVRAVRRGFSRPDKTVRVVRGGLSGLKKIVRVVCRGWLSGLKELENLRMCLLDMVRRKLRTVIYESIILRARRRSQRSGWSSVYYQMWLVLLNRVRPMLPTGIRGQGKPTVVFTHGSYYHFFLLARELRGRGWNAWAVTMNDPDDIDAIYSHVPDVSIFRPNREHQLFTIDRFLHEVKSKCDILHFSGVGMMRFSPEQGDLNVAQPHSPREFMDLKSAGVRIGYSSVGCNDGISQSEWYEWTGGMCDNCRYQTEPNVCSDFRNLGWGNKLALVCDVIASEFLPRLGYLAGDSVVTAPFAFCVDEREWSPGLKIPDKHLIESDPAEVIVLHAVGNFAKRTIGDADPKGTRYVVEAVESLQREGLPIRLHFVDNSPSGEMKYIQAQADIVVDQLYFGRYGAMARECLMLGKPVVGFLKFNRDEESGDALACLDECPIVNASPETLKEVLRDLATSAGKRNEIGRRSHEFALKWHSVTASADRFEEVWRERFGIGV